MTLIVATTICAGLAATNLLRIAQVRGMALRYGLAVAAAYLSFLGLIRLWMWYVGIQTARAANRSSVDFSGDGIDVIAGGLRQGSVPFTGGGQFGGGGATGSWGDAAGSSSKSGFANLLDVDVDDDSGSLALVIAIVVAVVVAIAASFWLIYAAPAILSEVAFQAVLAGSMAQRTKQMSRMGWAGAVWRKTFWPFLAVLVCAVALGLIAHRTCPAAVTLAQALHCQR